MVSSRGPVVVVGVGPVAGDESVVAVAGREAAMRRARLEVVHVVAPGTRPAGAVRRRIDAAVAAVRAAHPALAVAVIVVTGDPVAEILGRCCELLVVGHRQRSRRRAGAPSVAVDVTDRATAPVLVWPVDTGPHPPVSERRDGVLVAVGGRGEDAVLDFAFEEAAARRLPVVAEHVWSGSGDGPAGEGRGTAAASEDAARALLGDTVGRRSERVPVRRVARRSLDVAIALNAAARSAEVAVIGAHRGRVGGGGVRRALIRRAACPVVVVPMSSPGVDAVGERPGAEVSARP